MTSRALQIQTVARLARFCLARFCLPLLLLAGLAVPVQAATQGATGPDSTGTLDIVGVQNINVIINGLDDMPLGTWTGSGALSSNDNLCIGRNGTALFGTGSYRILATGDGEPADPTAFTLSNGANTIRYNAWFNDQTGTAGRQSLTSGVALTGQTGFGLWFFFNMFGGCAVENANVSIEVPESELRRGAGAYTGSLTLMLLPE